MNRRTFFRTAALATGSLALSATTSTAASTPLPPPPAPRSKHYNWDRSPHERKCRDLGCECDR